MGDYATVAFELTGETSARDTPVIEEILEETTLSLTDLEETTVNGRFTLTGEMESVRDGASSLQAVTGALRVAGVSFTFRDLESTDEGDSTERSWRPGWQKERIRHAHRGGSIGLDSSEIEDKLDDRSDLEIGMFVRNYFADGDGYREDAIEDWNTGQPIVRFVIDETGKSEVTQTSVPRFMDANSGYEDAALGELIAMARDGRYDDSSEIFSSAPYTCLFSVAREDRPLVAEQLERWFDGRREDLDEMFGERFTRDVREAIEGIRGDG